MPPYSHECQAKEAIPLELLDLRDLRLGRLVRPRQRRVRAPGLVRRASNVGVACLCEGQEQHDELSMKTSHQLQAGLPVGAEQTEQRLTIRKCREAVHYHGLLCFRNLLQHVVDAGVLRLLQRLALRVQAAEVADEARRRSLEEGLHRTRRRSIQEGREQPGQQPRHYRVKAPEGVAHEVDAGDQDPGGREPPREQVRDPAAQLLDAHLDEVGQHALVNGASGRDRSTLLQLLESLHSIAQVQHVRLGSLGAGAM
mmetsp:Transcript_22784/g.59472  ORF Transcript_22784/g.59472 Transcript_22784/m.59472 type:complete len:255 (-) Transcript_22784:838-1602(-)